MERDSSGGQPRRYFRFSLGMLMAIVACVCCFLGGQSLGHRGGAAEILNKLPATTRTYYVDDLVINVDATDANQLAGGVAADFDSLMKKIVSHCSPATWDEAGGTGRISPFPLNYSLIIHENRLVHEEIAEYLDELRLEKFGPDYKFVPGGLGVNGTVGETSKKYPVGDLVIDPKSGQADYDTLTTIITETCSPDVWEEAGGPGRIWLHSLKQSLVIKTTGGVHQQVGELLTKLRKDKFGPGYQAASVK